MMKERIIRYPGKTIDVYFTVYRCTQVAECIRGAPEVFNKDRAPWIIADAAEPDKVAGVVMRCPTGALHFKRKDGGDLEPFPDMNTIDICRDGPYYVRGDIKIRNYDNTRILRDTRIALCRCGVSQIKPLCDNTHKTMGFRDLRNFTKRKGKNDRSIGKIVVTLKKNGPLELNGPVEIRDPEGDVCFRGHHTHLCRCGNSDRIPFCDGSHSESDFITDENIILYRSESKN